MDLRDSLAMHPASLPSPHATKTRSLARDAQAMHPAPPSRVVVNIRGSLAMHPASFPLPDNALSDSGLDDVRLRRTFDRWWTDLETQRID
jgi:hypothetical protein